MPVTQIFLGFDDVDSFKIYPGTAEPGGLPSMGLHRVGHKWSVIAAAYNTLEKNFILLL